MDLLILPVCFSDRFEMMDVLAHGKVMKIPTPCLDCIALSNFLILVLINFGRKKHGELAICHCFGNQACMLTILLSVGFIYDAIH